MDAMRHEIMTLIAQDADQLGGQRLIAKPAHDGNLRLVILSHSAVLEMPARTVADCFYIKHELSISHYNLLRSNRAHCDCLSSSSRVVAVPGMTDAATSTSDSRPSYTPVFS